MTYTIKNLRAVEDQAPKFGVGEVQDAHFANEDLEVKDTGVAYMVVKPGQRQGFGHRHEDAEEVYVVTAGSGRVNLDGEIVDIRGLDAIRVPPQVTRQFEAGSDGLELVAFGPRRKGDGEIVQDFWKD